MYGMSGDSPTDARTLFASVNAAAAAKKRKISDVSTDLSDLSPFSQVSSIERELAPNRLAFSGNDDVFGLDLPDQVRICFHS